MRRRLLRWQHQGPIPGRDDLERLCLAVEALAKSNSKRPWKVRGVGYVDMAACRTAAPCVTADRDFPACDGRCCA